MGGQPVKPLGMVNTYRPTSVDQDYADAQRAAGEQRVMSNPLLNPTPEPPVAAPGEEAPEVPGRKASQPKEGEGKSPAYAGVETLVDQVKQGVMTMIQGLARIPEGEPMKGARQALIEGFLPMIASPITALVSAGGQTFENLAPETANAPFLEGPGAESFMRLASLKFNEPLTPEESVVFRQPITVRQAMEILVPFALPAAPKAVRAGKVVGGIVKEEFRTAPERGSIGPRQEGSKFQGAPGSGGASVAPVPPTPSGMVRLYRGEAIPTGKANLPDWVKQGLKDTGAKDAEGRWYTDDPKIAEWYQKEAKAGGGEGRIVYVDVPRDVYEQSRMGTQPGAAKFSADKEREFFIPPEYSRQAKPMPGPEPQSVPKPPAGAEARINVGRIDATESVKATIIDLNKFAGERLEQHRKVKGHKETVAEAAATRWTVEQMLTHEPETILVDEAHAFRLRETAKAAAELYDSLGQKAIAGDTAAAAKLNEIYPIAVKLSALDEAQGRNLARGLEMRKEMATGALAAKSAGPAKLLELSRKLGEEEPDPLMAYRRFAMLRKDQQRGFFVNLYNGMRFGRDLTHSIWIQSLLSNPKTHAANLFGTSMIIAGDIPETAAAGWINAAFFRNPEGVQLAEAAIKLRALAEAQASGFRLAAKTWETGEQPWGRSPMSEHPRISAQTYGFDPDSNFGRFVDVMGANVRSKITPTRMLLTEDAYMKGVAYDLEIRALAHREALARGKTGKALEREVAQLEARPTAEMIETAQERATLLTLNKELGPAGRALISAANALPLGRVLFPFMQTPGNSGKYVFQRLPGLSLLSQQNWSDIAAGGALRDRAMARIAVGHAMGTVFAYEVSQGHITGAGPVDKNLAALQRDPATSTKPPFSICPPWSDSCYGFSRADPLGAYMGAIGTYVELSSQIPDQEAFDEWAAYGETIVVAGGRIGINKNYMQGASNVLEAISDPNTRGGKLVNSYARTLVPAGLRELTRQMDDNLTREVNSIPSAITSGLPWAAQQNRANRNWITGEYIRVPPGWAPWPVAFLGAISPITVTKKNAHPVFQEIQKNEVNLPAPPRYVGPGPKPEDGVQLVPPSGPGRKVKLTDPEYEALITFQTDTVKFQGRNLFQALEHLVASDKYKKASVGRGMGQSILIRAEYQKYMETAMRRLEDPAKGSPNLRRDVRQAEEARYNAQHRPITSPKSPQFDPTSIGR